MPRILMVIRPGGGGAFGHVARLSEELSKRGYEVAICGPHGADAAGGVEVIPLEMERSVSTAGDLRAVSELASIYRRWRPDLIHAHGSKGGIVARLARYGLPHAPLVHTPHGYAFDLQVVGRVQRAMFYAIEQAMAPFATGLLAVCEHEGKLAARLGLRRRVRVVYNGVEAGLQAPSRPQVGRPGGPTICVASELHPRKGTLTFIDALPLVLGRFPDARITWAGEGPDREAAERRIAELGIGSSVSLPGLIDDVPSLLATSDLYVSPSWAESFPYSVLEAMRGAMPIVATDVGGVGEAIEDGVTGRLVPARDATALGRGMLDLLSEPERAGELGEAARSRVVNRFSLQRMVEGTIAVYAEVGAWPTGSLR